MTEQSAAVQEHFSEEDLAAIARERFEIVSNAFPRQMAKQAVALAIYLRDKPYSASQLSSAFLSNPEQIALATDAANLAHEAIGSSRSVSLQEMPGFIRETFDYASAVRNVPLDQLRSFLRTPTPVSGDERTRQGRENALRAQLYNMRDRAAFAAVGRKIKSIIPRPRGEQ